MRFCFITETWPDDNESHICGSGVQIYYLAKTLARKGHQVTVVLTAARKLEQNSHIHFFALPPAKRLSSRLLRAEKKKIVAKISECDPEVIYTRGKLPETKLALNVANLTGAKFVWASNSDQSGERFKYLNHTLDKKGWRLKSIPSILESWYIDKTIEATLSKADLVLAQTTWQQKRLYQNFQCSSVLFHSGHPVPLPIQKANSKPRIVWLANLTPVKRPHLFLRLVKECPRDIDFVMAGHAHNPKIINEIDTLKKERDNFSYLGGVSLRHSNELMASSDIFCLSSEYEGIANTFIQACLHGLPTLSLGHQPEDWITRYRLGSVTDNFKEWKNSILDYAYDKRRRHDAGKRAYRFAQNTFDIEKIADRLLMAVRS